MKPAIRYLIILGIALIALVFVIFYREYLGEDTATAIEKSTNSLIDKPLNAVVTDTSVNKTDAGLYALRIDYTDIDTREASSFFMSYRNHSSIAIGDTVTKGKGEKLLLIYRQQGMVTSVPID